MNKSLRLMNRFIFLKVLFFWSITLKSAESADIRACIYRGYILSLDGYAGSYVYYTLKN